MRLGPQRVSFRRIQRAYFVTLARKGIFGRTPGDVARRLVDDQLQQLVQEGWITLEREPARTPRTEEIKP